MINLGLFKLKKLRLFLLYILLTLLFPKISYADYSCVWLGTGPIGDLPPVGTCQIGRAICSSDSTVPSPNACQGKSYAFCTAGGSFACVGETTCSAQGGHFTPIAFACLGSGIAFANCSDCATGFKCCPNDPSVGVGTFGCQWNGSRCWANTNSCTNGAQPVDTICGSAPNATVCGALQSLPCNLHGSAGSGSSGGPPLRCANGKDGIDTAMGCVPVGGNNSDQEIAAFFLKWGLGIGGGIAFILIVVASYQIMSSSGDPKRLQSGKELLTAAIMGLFLLLFSAFILNFIGINLLGIF